MPPEPGTAAAAIARPDFRRLYIAGFASNIGSWMQTVVIGPFVYRLSGDSAVFAGLVMFAQLGPQLLLAIPGGAISNRARSRKHLMQLLQIIQLIAALFLWQVARQPTPHKWLLVLGVAVGGIAGSMYAPNSQAILPDLAGIENLPGAISLNSAQVNGSRVIGPVLFSILHRFFNLDASGAFLLNAISFVWLIIVLAKIQIPNAPRAPEKQSVWTSLTEGIVTVRQSPVLSRAITTMVAMSLFSLVYIGQFPSITERLLHINSKGNSYAYLYAIWGVGSLLSALSMGTVFSHVDKRKVSTPLLIGSAIFLTAFAFVRSIHVAYPVGFLLGCCYFGTPTALLTIVQQELTPRTRAPVMALWFMAFGGMIPLASLWGGWLMDTIGGTRGVDVVLIIGALVSLFLARWGDLRRIPATQRPVAAGRPDS